MKERSILFSTPMARAILNGTKTQTRRIAKEFEGKGDLDAILRRFPNQRGCPYGEPGDRLWVRETWAPHPDFPDMANRSVYRADPECKYDVERWRPSIHMPRRASRILLEITGVRVERLQSISEQDARAEGVTLNEIGLFQVRHTPGDLHNVAVGAYRELWENINGAGGWDANPWVWVIEFRRIDAQGGSHADQA